MFISQCNQQLRSTWFFMAPTVMKSGLHVKAVNLSEKWLVYPVSFHRIATVALNQWNCSQTVETEKVHSICSWSVQRENDTKYFGRIVDDKDYKVIQTGRIKMATISPFFPNSQNVINMPYKWSTQHTRFCDYHIIQTEILRALRSTTFATSSWAPLPYTFDSSQNVKTKWCTPGKNLSWYLLR